MNPKAIRACLRLFVLSFIIDALPSQAAIITWTNFAGGNWSSPLNWSPNQVPGATDTALITTAGNYSVTLDISPTVAGLTVGTSAVGTTQSLATVGQTLTVNGPIQVTAQGLLAINGGNFAGTNVLTGALSWSGGSISGNMTINPGGAFNIVASGGNGFSGLVLTNNGTVNWTNTAIYGISGGNAHIYNYGTWNAQSDNSFFGGYNGGTTLFDNFGAFVKSGSGGTTTLDANVIFNNSGTVTVTNGTLVLQGGGTNSGGTFTTTSGSAIDFYNALFTNTVTFAGSGAYLAGNTTFAGTISGTLTWDGGSLSGVLTMATNSVFNIVAGGGDGLTGLVLTNNGTVNWTNTQIYGKSGANAQIYNYGTWNAQSDDAFTGGYNGGTTLFDNFGIFIKTGNSGATILDASVIFNNTGTVTAASGTLEFLGGGANNGVGGFAMTGGGAFVIDNYNFGPGVTFAGSGNVALGGSTMMNGAISIPNAELVSGNLGGTNVFTGALTWAGGSLSGTMTLSGGSTMAIVAGGGDGFNGLLFTNNGTVTWTNTTLYGLNNTNAQIYNQGTWDLQSDNVWVGGYNGGTTLFVNKGTFLKSGGSGTVALDTSVVFNNTGRIIVQQGTLSINGGGTTSSKDGTFNISTNAVLNFDNYGFSGNTSATGGGPLILGGSSTTFNGTMSGPNIIWSGGNVSGILTLAINSVFYIVSGGGDGFTGFILTNNGTVDWTNTALYGINTSNAQIYNYGTWNAQTDNTFSGGYNGGTTLFDNFGTFLKSGNTGTTTLDGNVVFNNTGTIVVQGGSLAILGGGTDSGSGTVNAVNGSVVELGGITFANNTTITNAGIVQLTGSTVINGTFTAPNVQLIGGTLGGTNVLVGTLTWISGNMTGVMTVATNSVLNIEPGGGDGFSGLVLTNNGTVNWSNTTLYSLNGVNAQIYNYGLWNAQSDNTFFGGYNGGTSLFDNFGTFLKSGNTGGTTLNGSVIFNNLGGTVAVNSGTLFLQGGGVASGGTYGTTGNSIIDFFGYTFTNNPNFTGAGNILAGNAVFGGGDYTGTLTWAGGNISGALTIPNSSIFNIVSGGGDGFNGIVLTNNGTVNWTNTALYGINNSNAQIYNYGTWNAQSDNVFYGGYNTGKTLFDNFGTFQKSGDTGDTTLDGNVIFNNTGTVTISSGNLLMEGAGTNNGGSFATASGSVIDYYDYTFVNNTTLAGTGSTLVGNADFDGTITGTLTWVGGSLSGVLTMAANSVFNIVPGGGDGLNGLILTNNGTVNWTNVQIYGINGANAQIYNYGMWNAQTDNPFTGGYNGGTTLFDNFGIFLKSGTTGATTLDSQVVFNNTGVVSAQSGTIALQGNYSLAGGTLNYGLNSLTNYGTISLAGNPALTGTLSANLNNGYIPAVGNSFPVLTFASSSGLFSKTNLPPQDIWQTTYNAGNITISVLTAFPAPPTLFITQSAPNAVLSWTTNSAGYVLNQSPVLVHPIAWTPVTNNVTVVGGNKTVTVPATNAARFYQLIAP